MMRSHPLSLLAVTIISVTFFAMPEASHAADVCCRCNRPSDDVFTSSCLMVDTTLLENPTDCSTLPAATDLGSGWTCGKTVLTDTQCRTIAEDGVCSTAPQNASLIKKTAGDAVTGSGQTPKRAPDIIPNLNVNIPGFVAPTDSGLMFGTYVAAVYRYLISIAVIIATVMFIWGGFIYLVGSSGVGSVMTGKSIMLDAVIGLILLFSANLILRTLNPALTNFTSLKIQPIETSYAFMESVAGFQDTASSQLSSDFMTSLGTAPAPSGSGNISIDGIPEIGTPAQQLNAYCTRKDERSAIQTTDQKLDALTRAILGFKRVCIDKSGCVYVRGGYTDLASGRVGAGASDTPWLINWIKTQTRRTEPMWSETCEKGWEAVKSTFYTKRNPNNPPPELLTYEYSLKENEERGSCWRQLKTIYDDAFLKVVNERGLFGGDCGSTIVSIFDCAGAPMKAKVSSALAWYGQPKSNYVVLNAMSAGELRTQLEQNGPLRFGDIFILGSGGRQHNFIYTGGRTDVPFEIFEMGGGIGADGVVGRTVSLPGLSRPAGGARIQPPSSLAEYLARYANGNPFPITVARLYE